MGKRAASSSVASIAEHRLNSDGLVAHTAFLEERAREGQGYKALKKSLENELGITCTEHTMRTWITNWKSRNNGDAPGAEASSSARLVDLAGLGPRNSFLEARARAGQSYTLLRKSLENELGVTCSEHTMRTWIANWKSRNEGDASDPAASSSARALNLAGLGPHNGFLEERARAGQGYKALKKSLENELGVTCSERTIRTWITNWKSRNNGDAPDAKASSSARLVDLAGLGPHESFLEEQARAGQDFKALRKSLENELGVTCSEQTMRTWIANWKSRNEGDASDPAASSSARALNLAGLGPYSGFLEERARTGQGFKALRKSLEKELGVTCSERTMRTWMTSWKSRRSADAPDAEASSSAGALNLAGLGPYNGFLEERARAGQGNKALRKAWRMNWV